MNPLVLAIVCSKFLVEMQDRLRPVSALVLCSPMLIITLILFIIFN